MESVPQLTCQSYGELASRRQRGQLHQLPSCLRGILKATYLGEFGLKYISDDTGSSTDIWDDFLAIHFFLNAGPSVGIIAFNYSRIRHRSLSHMQWSQKGMPHLL